ncbi:Na+/H+ antiporter subunit E [Arthrobacter sulfonylureivorans]|uniref:Na+/H+ antiporter subunit E n=1 Tax=Arthrobacter sulfonylureivorans TaxID=2486855 RepID=A0ABY3W837_9MICC|nr:Na+/H+ antiporter subunit E [Arthrobacter sulfonylureivorans]UNK46509.1 Na+/H+ antiporter subunit E [Arthrobacter sulfonylureivorans]
MRKPRISIWVELPLLAWLVFLWGALWQDFSAGNLIFGLLIALVIVNLFYLPPVELSGRFNPLAAVVFAATFVWKVAVASFEVLWLALTTGPRLRNAVVAVHLRSHSDLLVTATGHAISLIPGSFVVDVDRSTSTLYLHVIDVATREAAEDFEAEVRKIEAGLIRVMGSKEELELVKAEGTGRGGAA